MYADDKKKTGFLKEVHVMVNQKKRHMKAGEVHIEILNQVSKPPINDHTMKMSQGRRLPRRYSEDKRDNTMLIRMPSLDWTRHCTLCQRRRKEK